VPPRAPFGELEVMQALSVIDKALKTKALRDRVIEGLSKILPGGLKREVTYRAEREDVELFRSKLAAEGVSRDAVSYYVQYLVKFLDEVGWVLSTETLQRVYTIRQPRVMGKTAVVLKRFINTVVKVKDPQIAPSPLRCLQNRPEQAEEQLPHPHPRGGEEGVGGGAQDVVLRRRCVGVNGGDRRGAEPPAEG